MGKKYFPEQFAAAVAKRTGLLGSYAAVRLVDGDGDSIPEIHIDRFGACAVVHLQGDCDAVAWKSKLSEISSEWNVLGIETVFLRQRFRESARSAEQAAELIYGTWAGAIRIEEHKATYLIDPERHINAGFFIDMRDVRRELQKGASAKRVLNLFCYTGSLGLSAFAGGAAEVVQVDISKGILSWAKENLELNAKYPGKMRFIPEDSIVFMSKEERRIAKGASRYDIIIIDPPSFSRSSQGVFQIERDIARLIEQALPLLVSGGQLILTTNYSGLEAEEVRVRICDVADAMGVPVGEQRPIVPPIDFPTIGELSIASRGAIVVLG